MSDVSHSSSYDLASDDTSVLLGLRESTGSYSSDSEQPSEAIFFHTDGTTSDTRIVLEDQYGSYVVVSLRGLTGAAKVGRVRSAEELP